MKRDLLLQSDTAPVTAAAAHARAWHHALLVTGILLLWIVVWYAGTGRAMVQIWARSDTFAHGFVVPAIVLWLVWRERRQLGALTPRPWWWGLALLTGAGFVWLLGELAAVNAVSQFALTALLVLAVVAVLGTTVARKLAFPLAFLFFAVPVGEFMMPQLMEWTADFTVLALRLSGVPVYREGGQFVIPSGSWSVVEACSGLRYLIASLMVGTLFAHLAYRSVKRKLAFVVVALLVPIVANWLRAYMIVMLGHLSENKLAVGVDHLIYGWLFFGVVIAVMLGIGARWREDDVVIMPVPPRKTAPYSPVPVRRFWVAAVAVAVLAVFGKIGYWAIESKDVAAPVHLASVTPIDKWLATGDAVVQWRPHFENPSDEMQRTFRNGDQRVGLFIAYYRNQDYGRKLVSSENVLVKSNDPDWARISGGIREIIYNEQPLAIRTSSLRGADGQRMLVWQWYWINGTLTASDPWAKGQIALSRLQGRGDDSAVIIVYAPEDQPGKAARALELFILAAGPEIEAALRRTRDMR